jgi:hypothetical protein
MNRSDLPLPLAVWQHPDAASMAGPDRAGLIDLLALAWQSTVAGGDGTVPADDDSLAQLTRLGDGWPTSLLRARLSLWFEPAAGGRLACRALAPALAGLQRHLSGSAKGGRASGVSRRRHLPPPSESKAPSPPKAPSEGAFNRPSEGAFARGGVAPGANLMPPPPSGWPAARGPGEPPFEGPRDCGRDRDRKPICIQLFDPANAPSPPGPPSRPRIFPPHTPRDKFKQSRTYFSGGGGAGGGGRNRRAVRRAHPFAQTGHQARPAAVRGGDRLLPAGRPARGPAGRARLEDGLPDRAEGRRHVRGPGGRGPELRRPHGPALPRAGDAQGRPQLLPPDERASGRSTRSRASRRRRARPGRRRRRTCSTGSRIACGRSWPRTAPAWYPPWCRTHAIAFSFRRAEDAEVMARWWPALRDFQPTEAMMAAGDRAAAANEATWPRSQPRRPLRGVPRRR